MLNTDKLFLQEKKRSDKLMLIHLYLKMKCNSFIAEDRPLLKDQSLTKFLELDLNKLLKSKELLKFSNGMKKQEKKEKILLPGMSQNGLQKLLVSQALKMLSKLMDHTIHQKMNGLSKKMLSLTIMPSLEQCSLPTAKLTELTNTSQLISTAGKELFNPLLNSFSKPKDGLGFSDQENGCLVDLKETIRKALVFMNQLLVI